MEKQIKNRFERAEKRIGKIEDFIEKGGLSKKGKLIKCHRCGKTWLCKSKSWFVSCPNCGTKTKSDEEKKEELVKCFKCGKKLKKKDAKYGYNSYFHESCFKEFKEQAIEEVDKGLKEIL